MKTGLVLEGGAMRGMFTAGALDVFWEEGIRLDGVIGVSAGAAFGCNYVSGQAGRAIRYNRTYCRDARYCGIRSLLRTGNLYGGEFCYHEIPETLDPFDGEAFQRSGIPFYCVATDCRTGEPVCRRIERADREDLEWIRASASMPAVSRPVKLEGRLYLDGGISDSVPLALFEKMGYAKNVVILTRPAGYRKTGGGASRLAGLAVCRYPALARAVSRRTEMYNGEMDYVEMRERQGASFVLRPELPLPVRRVEKDPEKLQAAYEIGRNAARERMDELRAFLAGGVAR